MNRRIPLPALALALALAAPARAQQSLPGSDAAGRPEVKSGVDTGLLRKVAFEQKLNAQLPLDLGDWLTDLGNLRREVVAAEPLNESRRLLLHELAQREVCGYDQCPSRQLAREHARINPIQPEKKS